jgi:hypothetical protein
MKDWILIHVPPRGAGSGVPVESGTVRGAQRVYGEPARIVGMAGVDTMSAVVIDFDAIEP